MFFYKESQDSVVVLWDTSLSLINERVYGKRHNAKLLILEMNNSL